MMLFLFDPVVIFKARAFLSTPKTVTDLDKQVICLDQKR